MKQQSQKKILKAVMHGFFFLSPGFVIKLRIFDVEMDY